ncbi:type II toxin-antitoxin system RelE/ParE family toxin [Arsenicicoccus cauae]|uniref:type II toxin-antitoxin system RelE family toxin n=1 Tax=Arsenicicoccus cauae TaxID=2663847 RepID=UPI00370D575F
MPRGIPKGESGKYQRAHPQLAVRETNPSATRQLRKLDAPRGRVQAAVELLATDPRPPVATKLVGGDGEWRVRTGDYRVIYESNDDVPLVLVLA